MYATTETARLADLVLPAAAWGEKDGTLINSERRIGLIKKVARAPGQALTDFSIFRLLAEYWGCGRLFERWTDPEAAFQILKELSRGQPCDISGIRDYRMIDEHGGIQWPYAEDAAASDGENATWHGLPAHEVTARMAVPRSALVSATHRRLFADGRFYHSDGKARFLFAEPTAMPEPPSDAFPLLLLTGRGAAAQWHTQTRTSKSAVLRKLYPPGLYVEINPTDARRYDIRPEQRVVVESQRGSIIARAFVTYTVQPGQVFLPMHYEETNRLTLGHFDPHSRQPSYKNCAVRVRAAQTHELPEYGS
jgi:assimilatory nitrate reductase catalytic subunit